MDKIVNCLREDAGKINADISDELDNRIRASLESVIRADRGSSRRPLRAGRMWWASSVTGVAAAAILIAVLNLRHPETVPSAVIAPAQPLDLPKIEWNAETAAFTRPLEQEIRDLRSDVEKARELVKQDIDRLF